MHANLEHHDDCRPTGAAAESGGAARGRAGRRCSPTAGSLPRRLLALWRDPITFLTALAAEQGDFAHVRLGTQHLYLLGHPALVQQAFVVRQRSFTKGAPLRKARLLLGDGLLTSDDERHRHQRRLIQPAFHRDALGRWGDVMSRYAGELEAGWRDGEVLDVARAMLGLAQRIVAKSLFDTDLQTAEAESAARALETFARGFGMLLLPGSRLLLALPIPAARRVWRARATLDALVYRMIAARAGDGRRDDVMSMLLDATDEDGRRMTAEQVRDEVMTLFLAGHDTTGHALAWSWHLLAQHPEVERTWHAELDEVLGERLPTADDVSRLPYTRQLLAESMRLYPPVPAMGRSAREAVELGGRSIPRGAIVEVCQWVLHRDARFFPDPERFAPERWTADFERELPPGAYLPFGIGPRMCIGMPFAWMAGVLALATIGRHWRLRPLDARPVERLARSITLRPRAGLPMRVERRGRDAREVVTVIGAAGSGA